MGNQVVIVTGGGRGIGRAICERFAAAGAQTVATARSANELAETKRAIEAAGGLCHVHPADITAAADVSNLMDATVQKFGRIDVLVNCAGVAPLVSIEELDPSIFDSVSSVNIRAVYLTCRAVWPIMKRQEEGTIVNISSMSAVDPFPGFEAYGAAKAWVNAWTNALAKEGRKLGIRTFAVAPGAVDTAMLRGIFPDYPPSQTLTPAEVAETVLAVTQPALDSATGQVIYIRKE